VTQGVVFTPLKSENSRSDTLLKQRKIKMNQIVQKGLEAITARTNLRTGLAHPNDMSAAKEMFDLLYQAGEVLIADEIESYAVMHGWQSKDAKELGLLGAKIGMGKKPRIKGGPWWKDGLIEQWQSEAEGRDT
jgi:hypothetical protein